MKIQQKQYSRQRGWEDFRHDDFVPKLCDLVLVFGSKDIISETSVYTTVQIWYPNAIILLASTAGEILDTRVSDDTLSLTAVHFEKSHVDAVATSIDSAHNSYAAGKLLGGKLSAEGLKSVFVISDGQRVNGSDLVQGLQDSLPEGTIITGGLAADGNVFQQTLVGLNEEPCSGRIAALGFSGDDLYITYGSYAGWKPYGPERLITQSEGNVLYELDHQPALDVYKQYLGKYAGELPHAGLLLPLSVRPEESDNILIRSMLSFSEEEQSITFAGNMPEGAYARLMKANFGHLIEGAASAARNAFSDPPGEPDLAILISCLGRKLVLDQRIEEETEIVRTVLGSRTAITGFYSYGEIAPDPASAKIELYNQTMTITTFREG